jgi:hypothetical protein
MDPTNMLSTFFSPLKLIDLLFYIKEIIGDALITSIISVFAK